MSDGLSRAVGAPMTFTIDGTSYLIGPFDLGDFGSVEAYLIRKKRKARLQLISDIRGDLPEDIWREEWEQAKADVQKITAIDPKEIGGWDEVDEVFGDRIVRHHDGWLDTREGMAYTLWLMFEKRYPGKFTLESLQTKVTEMAMAEFEELKIARDQTAGLDDAGKKLDWPVRKLGRDGRADRADRRERNSRGRGRERIRMDWRRLFWQLTLPGVAGGRGFSPEQAKRLTYYEARLYTSSERSLGGVQKMSSAEAADYIDPAKRRTRPAELGPVKHVDPGKRERELYLKRFGVSMPQNMVGLPEKLRPKQPKQKR